MSNVVGVFPYAVCPRSDSAVNRILADDFGLRVLPESAEICLQYVTASSFQTHQSQLPQYFPTSSPIMTLYTEVQCVYWSNTTIQGVSRL